MHSIAAAALATCLGGQKSSPVDHPPHTEPEIVTADRLSGLAVGVGSDVAQTVTLLTTRAGTAAISSDGRVALSLA
jgi:hypothetical protein